MRKWIVFAMILSLGLTFQNRPALSSETRGSHEENSPIKTPVILKTAAEAVEGRLQSLDQDLARAARKLSTVGVKSDAARAVIRQVQMQNPDTVIDACTISPEGVMLAVEPAQYRSFEGTDISGQEQIRTLLRTRQPVMSSVFRTVEGVAAVDMEHPVMGPDGKFLGSVSAIFQPWVLIGKCVQALLSGLPVEIWAMQPDGKILYDADRREVGRMLFSAPEYRPFPELLQLGRRIAVEPEGWGTYSYFKAGTNRVVHKDASWVTITMNGTTWRLVSVHPSNAAGKAPAAGQSPFSGDALRALAREPELIQALVRGDRETAMNRFRKAAMTSSGIYSLSYVDAEAVNRFGYPKENSLFGVDLRKQTDTASIAIAAAIDNQRELVYSGPLVEGGGARYFLMPVLDNGKYLGALLWIKKE